MLFSSSPTSSSIKIVPLTFPVSCRNPKKPFLQPAGYWKHVKVFNLSQTVRVTQSKLDLCIFVFIFVYMLCNIFVYICIYILQYICVCLYLYLYICYVIYLCIFVKCNIYVIYYNIFVHMLCNIFVYMPGTGCRQISDRRWLTNSVCWMHITA